MGCINNARFRNEEFDFGDCRRRRRCCEIKCCEEDRCDRDRDDEDEDEDDDYDYVVLNDRDRCRRRRRRCGFCGFFGGGFFGFNGGRGRCRRRRRRCCF